jgi:hypothetical protein
LVSKSQTTTTKSSKSRCKIEQNIAKMVKKLDTMLTEAEVDMLRKKLETKPELASAGHKAIDEQSAREIDLSVVEKPI